MQYDPDSPCAKRRRADAPQVINNITANTLNAYFAPVAGPAAIPEDTCPPNLFPEGERNHSIYQPHKARSYRVSHATRDGQLKAGCTNCTSNYKDMVQFAPPECNNNGRKRPQFFEALKAYSVAWEARDLEAARAARAEAEGLRNDRCPSCQESAGKLSPAQQACKDEYVRMRKAACLKNDGCANPDCAERGEQAWCVLHGDHLHTAKEEDEALRKKEALSSYSWWAYNGGVAAMRAEEAKGMQWICSFCHSLEPTSNQAKRCQDPRAKNEDGTPVMPDGRRGKHATAEEIKEYKDKHRAKIKYPKQQHVDARKRAVGCCKRCKRADVEGKEWAFHWDHRDPATKLIGEGTLARERGGVAGLVANNAKRADLDAPGFKDVLDEEMDKCDLLCHNCHHRKTWGYPPRE
tara:strand:- start:1139 stop:2359 length:1221 start_codon:yes stop_codon:yes gene_type:complete